MPAFPTAEGYGANSLGGSGRGGSGTAVTYTVTSLADTNTPGTLRYGCETLSGPRTIVFNVDGRIVLNSPIVILNPYVTIAGQTAPGMGIQLTKYDLWIRTHNVIVRFLRVRPGLDALLPRPVSSGSAGVETHGILIWGETGREVYNVIVDHCSVSWCTDGTISPYGFVHDCTIQWCMAYEGTLWGNTQGVDVNHSSGTLMANEPSFGLFTCSLHHNLNAHCLQRMLRMGTYGQPWPASFRTGQAEVVNNVVYNWTAGGGDSSWILNFFTQASRDAFLAAAGGATGTPGTVGNIIGNHWIRNAQTSSDNNIGQVSAGCRVYAADNIGPLSPGTPINGFSVGIGFADPWNFANYIYWPPGYNGVTAGTQATTPYSMSSVPVTTSAVGLVRDMVLNNAGCSRVVRNGAPVMIRDSADTRIAGNGSSGGEVRNGTGVVGFGITRATFNAGTDYPYPTLTAGTPWVDSNGDGIPNGWAGLPVGATAHQVSPTGYTYLENYLNELAGDVVSSQPDITPPLTPTGFTVS